MVMPSEYICSRCTKPFTGPDYFEIPILCDRCRLVLFAKKMEDNSIDIPSEISAAVDKYFWELV